MPSLVHWLVADQRPGRDAAPCVISKSSAVVSSSVGRLPQSKGRIGTHCITVLSVRRYRALGNYRPQADERRVRERNRMAETQCESRAAPALAQAGLSARPRRSPGEGRGHAKALNRPDSCRWKKQ
jgi:hypothetical protein